MEMIQPDGDESRLPGLTGAEELGRMKRKGIAIVIAVGTILLATLLLSSCTKPAVPEKTEKLRIGVFPDSISALVYVGQEKGFFKRHGLDVSLETFQTGAFAVNGLMSDKVDVATASGFVLALQGFKRPDLRTIGAISSTDIVEVVARRDPGIEKPEDLKGKRIGVTKNTIAEFFLSTLLSLSGILPGEARTVDLKPSDFEKALAEGKIDAVVCFPPWNAVKRSLGQNGVSWPIQGGQDYYLLLITRDELVKSRPRGIEGLLKGVLDAEDFLKKHESEAQAIVERTTGLDHASVTGTWAKTHFRVSLDQALLTLMEDEGRWAIQNRLVEAKKVSNYLPFLYIEGLGKLRPGAVGVVH
jgi:NitT/TauT family transport system substrate-binding protein